MFTAEAILHILIGLLMLALVVAGVRQVRRAFNSYGLIIVVVIAALVYDNLILGLGGAIGYGDTLRALNTPRFITHALLTPTMIIYAFGMARAAGLVWAQSRGLHIAFCLLATGLIALGAAQDIFNLQLTAYDAGAQVMGYKNAFVLIKGPPIPAILTVVVLMVVGAILLLRVRWPWLLAGAALMFVGALAMTRAPIAGNLGELALGFATMGTYLATARSHLKPAVNAARRGPNPATPTGPP